MHLMDKNVFRHLDTPKRFKKIIQSKRPTQKFGKQMSDEDQNTTTNAITYLQYHGEILRSDNLTIEFIRLVFTEGQKAASFSHGVSCTQIKKH